MGMAASADPLGATTYGCVEVSGRTLHVEQLRPRHDPVLDSHHAIQPTTARFGRSPQASDALAAQLSGNLGGPPRHRHQ